MRETSHHVLTGRMMKARIALLLMAAALTATLVAAGDPPALLCTLNWGDNPRNFTRSVDWVRAEAGYYFVKLGTDVPSLHQLYRDARTTGSATVVIDGWQAPRRSGLAPVATVGASWSATDATLLEPRGDAFARFRWHRDARRGEFLQVDLAPLHVIDLVERPVLALRLRSSHAGRFMRAVLLDREGGHHAVPLEIPETGKEVRLGPFVPGLVEGDGSLRTIRAIRFEKTATPEAGAEKIDVEVTAVLATRRSKDLAELFTIRDDLGGRGEFVRGVLDVQRLGGRVVLAVDACRLPGDCRLVGEGFLRASVARDAGGRGKFTVNADGGCVFEMRPEGEWSRQLAMVVSEELIRGLHVDGVFVKGLPAEASADAGIAVLLGRVRASMRAYRRDSALFVERATETTLRGSDVALGPQVVDLADFTYASAGTLVDVPIRSGRDVDALHRTFALGLKIASGPADLSRSFTHAPGSARGKITPAAMTSGDAKPQTVADYTRRLALARRSCEMFFDHWQGGRWCGRIVTSHPGCEIGRFTSGREHLYNVVNASDRPAGPIVLDVSHTRADRFVDMVSGREFTVEDGRLTLHLEPHAFAMLRTALTTIGRGKCLARTEE